MMWAELLARYAHEGNYTLIAYSRSKKRINNKIIKMVPMQEITSATIIFVCTSISSFPDVLFSLRLLVKKGTIVCDTCSVKEYPTQCMEKILPKECSLLGTHPMFGPDSIEAATKLSIVLSPIRITKAELRRCTTLFSLWGLQSIQMQPDEHDKISAYSQGVTHLIGRIAERMRLAPVDIATLGYQKILQVMEQTCRDNRDLFLDLERYNRYTPEMLMKFLKTMEEVCSEISGQDKEQKRK